MLAPAPGLALFVEALDGAACAALEAYVSELFERGRDGLLAKSYVPKPSQWEQTGQGRATVHFGCLVRYNKLLWGAEVAPLPAELERVLDLLCTCGLFHPDQRPDTCCVNEYERGTWIPPHVDSEAFARPFFTLSLLSEQETVFGRDLHGTAGEWTGGTRIRLPRGSVLRVDAPAAGPEVRHAVSKCTARRYSLVFRRLSEQSVAKRVTLRETVAAAALARQQRRIEAKLKRGKTPLHGARTAAEAAAARRGATRGQQAASAPAHLDSHRSASVIEGSSVTNRRLAHASAVEEAVGAVDAGVSTPDETICGCV